MSEHYRQDPSIIFLLPPGVHLLDLAGAAQVFYEANEYGSHFNIQYCTYQLGIATSGQLPFGNIVSYEQVPVQAGDYIFIPGAAMEHLYDTSLANNETLLEWLRNQHAKGAFICSICTGAFLVALTGLLDGYSCTTHWKRTRELQEHYPFARVLENVLFVEDNNIFTSAGVSSGIDMALHILMRIKGDFLTYTVARELVVYMRRTGNEVQRSVYLQNREHINSPVHRVQDWIIEHLHEKITIEQLAALIYTSSRNLTRLFKATTGITIGAYIEKLRVEKAMQLLKEKQKVEAVARECGFQTAGQLRNILQKHMGKKPSETT
ncbi:HTH-type transcriptional regulator glxA [Russula earlei]|uniref:HTH-type transcriptional regulator glxA n=1 Tax=Russula earlei TaxID=71964 RepID=A0ACC0TTA6_9AGAM|nr:HTH-type transcriptional regulator glxA [Russula earlei]